MLNFRKIIALILPNFQKSKTLKTFIVKNEWNKKFAFTKINKKKFVYNNWQFILLIGYIKKENDLKHEISMISFTYKYKKKKKEERQNERWEHFRHSRATRSTICRVTYTRNAHGSHGKYVAGANTEPHREKGGEYTSCPVQFVRLSIIILETPL